MPTLPIYMDSHATTPVDPRVLEVMLPYFSVRYGNAASRNHSFGWDAEKAVDAARQQVADLIGASAKEVVFTSGATESDNLAIKGVAEMYREKGDHIITCKTEHKAVLDTCKRLERSGFRITYLDPQKDGRVDPSDVKRAITDKTILISLMLANNEIGSRFTTVSILNTAVQEAFVAEVCDPSLAGGGVSASVLLPEGMDPSTALTTSTAQDIVARQTRLFFGREPSDYELEQVEIYADACTPKPCTAESFARPTCFALLSSAEMLFY